MDEMVEADFQAVIMHGGPAYMWMTPLLHAADEFTRYKAAAPETDGPQERN
jgi:hypothetical protein